MSDDQDLRVALLARAIACIRESNRDASVCSNCEKPIGANDPVWRLHTIHGLLGVVCRACAEDEDNTVLQNRYYASNKGRYHYYEPRHFWERECEACGRTVHVEHDDRRREHDFCSEVCKRRIYNEVQKDKRACRWRECAACGEPFTPPRSDAKYCSGKCRQKAYRERR